MLYNMHGSSVMTLDEVKQLAATPNRETLMAKMLGSLNAPISNLARLLSTIVDGGEEIADLVAKKNAEAAPAEEAKAEEAPAEAPVEEAKAEEAPAAEENTAE